MNQGRIELSKGSKVRPPSPQTTVGETGGGTYPAGVFGKPVLPRGCIAPDQLPAGDAEYWERITDRATD